MVRTKTNETPAVRKRPRRPVAIASAVAKLGQTPDLGRVGLLVALNVPYVAIVLLPYLLISRKILRRV
jgi:hypothetical protein